MNQREKQDFAEIFIDAYLAQGFGSLPKREIDLLVFNLLSKTNEYKGRSNYELSTLLRISESRIKNLKLNSTLKYDTVNSKAVLSSIIQRFVASEQFIGFEGGKLELSIEDPIEKREIEYALKKRGHYVEYTLNSEVLRISPARLFELIVDNLEKPEVRFNELVQSYIADSVKAREITDGALTLGQKFSRFRKLVLGAETMRELIGAAAGAI